MSKKKNKKSELKRQLEVLQWKYEAERQALNLLLRCCEENNAGWKRALKGWGQSLDSGIRRTGWWFCFSFFSNLVWMGIVAALLLETGGE